LAAAKVRPGLAEKEKAFFFFAFYFPFPPFFEPGKIDFFLFSSANPPVFFH